MAVKEILLLGNPLLYNISREVHREELAKVREVVADLQDTMANFRVKYGFGRAIAAPQIGELLRIIYMNLDNHSYALVNPRLEFGLEPMELWDDCMSFPGLEVWVKRFQKTKITYKDLENSFSPTFCIINLFSLIHCQIKYHSIVIQNKIYSKHTNSSDSYFDG